MRKGLYYILLSCMVMGLLLSCSDPIEDDDNNPEVNAVERLILPADNSVLTLSDDLQSTEEFEWQAAGASRGVAPKYEIVFFRENETVANPGIYG